jgi:diacylglycerol O-acyltransferase
MVLADGLGEGSAIVVKVHHCVADGFALVGVLLSLADEHAAEQPPARRAPSYRDLAFGPRDLARQAASFATSLARMVALPSDPPTSLRRPLSGLRHAAWSEGYPLARIQDAAHGRGATVNDLLVAALTGALRGHLAAAGGPVNGTDVRALVPVNLRPPGAFGPGLGNRFGLVFLPLAVHARTAASRLAAARARMLELKGSPDAVVTHAVLGALGAIPRAAEQPLIDFFTRKASLVVTNLPGPKRHLHLAGNRIESVMFWVPHPALLGVGVSILSYAGEVRIGVRADAAVMPDPADLVARFGAELRALGAA